MKSTYVILFALFFLINIDAQDFTKESKEEREARMKWWREARFGMFIHWGIYSVPAGEWNGNTSYAEWIRTQAEIPLEEYDKFVSQFNPVKFNAKEWVKTTKDAGMKYIVITSKHHDGFCMFDSKYTDYDIMSTPFNRDILKELSQECEKQGIKLCFYHSIMDWHHPDYLPRRDWEKNRTTEGADFERYIQHMKNQLRELVTNYKDLGVLWFDGEWENTWSDERGIDLYNYIRSLKNDIIINNRVSSSRSGMEGFTKEGGFAGDFGTPEQQIPATGLPGVDWESCITMNDHWGYNKNDKNFKSSKEIIQMLSDIASKGGNYLLNVGPTAEGIFPPECVEILGKVGKWMEINGESIYRTNASPFRNLEWGRCTQKNIGENTRLYLHVFIWPSDGKLIIPGIYSEAIQSYLLSDESGTKLKVERNEDAVIVSIPAQAPDENNSVVVFDVVGKADINNPPVFESDEKIFIENLGVKIKSDREKIEIRYTTDGSIPSIESQLYDGLLTVTETTTLKARCFRDGKPVSGTSEETYTKVKPKESVEIKNAENGIYYKYFEGKWEKIPDFNLLKAIEEGIIKNISLEKRKVSDYFGFEFSGFIKIPEDGVYNFFTASDDGSSLYIGDKLIVNNDFQHGIEEKKGTIALKKGYHPFKVCFFESAGGEDLKVYYKVSGKEKQLLPDDLFFYEK